MKTKKGSEKSEPFFFVLPRGFEPLPKEPESLILSIRLWELMLREWLTHAHRICKVNNFCDYYSPFLAFL